MKSTMLVVFLMAIGTAMFSQVSGGVQPINGPSYQPISNPQHADQHSLSPDQNLRGSGSITYAQGERPLWEFGSDKVEPSLGNVARAYREGHVAAEKATIVFEKQGQ